MNSNPDGYVEQVDEHPHDLDPQPQEPASKSKEQEIPISKSKPKLDQKKKKEKAKAHKVLNEDSSSSDDDEEALELLKKGGKHRDARKTSQKSLQLQQQELEESNKNALKWAIRLRSFSRIVFLIVVTTFLFTGFYLIFTFLAFYQGANPVHVDSNITLNITNCKLKIIDMAYSPLQNSQFKGAFLSSRHTLKSNVTKVPKVPTEVAVAPDMALVYTIPGRFNIDPSANVSHVETVISGGNYSYVFQNILSAESCEVDLHIYQKTRINNLQVNCQTSCFVMMLAQNISFQSVSFKGDLIEANIAHLETQNISFDATQGRFQGGYVDFNIADVRLEQGDIILQTDKELMLNWTHATPNYCLGSPVIANPIVIGCQEPPQAEIDAFISGVGTGSKKPKKAVAKKDDKKGKEEGKDKGKDEGKEKGKDEGKEKGKDEGKHHEDDTEDDILAYDEDEIELFFEPDQDTGTVILLPFMDTYEQSKEFQGQFLEEPAKGSTPPPKGTEPAKGNKTNDNMHSKTKASKAKEKALFLPSCYGSSIFCSTPNCTSLKEALSKLPNATAPTEVPKGRRNLQETADANATAPAANKTAPIDYNGLNAQAAKMLPHEIPKGVRFVNVTGRFGNVYVNLIPGKEQVIDLNDTVIHGVSYASGAVKFDLPSQKILKDYKTQAKDPHNFDPTFILEVGSKATRSDNFQQWTVTYNPAYSYIRPWWIGTFSFTLMSTATWDLGLNLSPGFCPYVPELDLNDIHSTGFLIKEFFKDADNAITTINWQNSIEFPKTTYQNTSNGVRQVIESNDEFERWINVEKINETNYKLNVVNLDNSPATQWAAYISFVIAGLVAAIGIIGVVYVVNSVYSEIITQVASTNKYSTIEKKNDTGAVQPLMSQPPEKKTVLKEGSDSEDEDKVKKPKKEIQSEEFEILLNFNPGRLFYQLFVLAPPLSAFIDYLCVLLSKKYINSAKEFYTHLFMAIEKPSSERQLHDLTTETILGNDMKTLYEKFCYLNGFLEQKLDDETNLKLLKEKGFKIETREDAQTESYVKVLLNGMMPKITVPKDKAVLDLFIENCCKTSNFEEDNVVVSTFNESYQEFCTINHLQYQQASAAELQKKYNIISKYIPQQWVVRDEEAIPKVVDPENQTFYTKVQDSVNSCVAKCMPDKETFAIDRQKMQNHYSLIMNNPEKIKTTAELALANKELILFGGWWAVDFVTVIAHFITTIVLILPLFIFTILEKILYSPYSLIPRQFLITLEDVMFNYWILPLKLYHESNWIKNILILVGIYWVYSIIDLLYYYVSMEFPQENFFRKVSPKTTNRIQLLFRQIMWGLVLYSAFQFLVFASLAIVWLILGAIVNPTAFLPYATAAATFVAVVSGKAAQFKEIAQDGFQTVIDFVEKIAQQQMGNMITKFDLKGKVGAVMESSTFKNIAGQAASLGLVDQATLTHLEENAESMLANPEKALESAAGEISEIAANPGAFVAKMMKQMEEKAVSMIKEQLVKQVDEFGEQLADVVLAIFKNDKIMFKNNMAQLMYAAAKNPKLESLKKMSTPIMNLIWEFAYPSGTASQQADDYIQQLLQPCTDCIAGLVAQELQQIDPALDFEQKTLSVALSKAISLEKNLQKNNISAVFKDLEEIIQSFATEDRFPQIKQLAQYGGLLKVAMSLFENKKGGQLAFHKIFNIISGFFDDITQLKELKDLLGIIELLINTFRKQQKQLPTKTIRSKIQKGLSFILSKATTALDKKVLSTEDLAILKNSSLITLMFNFMQHHFDKIPKDQLKDVFKTLDNDCKSLGEIVRSEKEHKKLVKLMSMAFEFMALFMENNKELVTTLHNVATSFSIEEKKAEQIQMIASIKYLKQTTFEGSKQEDQLFESLAKNGILLNLQGILRIEMKVLQGIICQLLHLWNKQCVQELYYFMSKINKVDLHRVRQFFSILILFKSKSESHLTNAAVNLCIPRDYILLILLSKQVLNLQFVDYDNLLRLGVEEDKLKELFKETDLKVFLSKIKEDIIKQDDGQVLGGNSQSLKTFLIEGIAAAGQITKKSLQEILLALGNNQNEFAKLTQNDIDLLFNILQLKNIELNNQNALSSDSKQGIYTFATILNVSKPHFEDLVNIVFLTNSDRVVQSIINTQKAETPYIELTSQKDYEGYLEFMYSKLEMISKKHLFIQNKFKQLFPMINLPTSLVEKLLFNKDAQMDINSFYELAYQIIERDENGKLPKGTLQQLNNSVSFITSTLNTTDLTGLRTSLNKSDLTEGQGFLLQMLNENSRKRSITIFMDYLLINSKRNKNDDTRPLPQVYHLFASLYLFFTGEQSELLVKYEEQGKPTVELTIVDYLAKKLDIKPEFFEALHTFYLKDNQKFTQVMIKFMRRQQACEFETKYPGIKIPLQSLVKIPDQFVLNFINLITRDNYQTSFFAKELGLDNDIVVFVNNLMQIQSAKTPADRRLQLQYLSTNSQTVGPLLKLVNIQGDELKSLITLMFQDYQPNKIEWIINDLRLQSKVKVNDLRVLLQLDNVIDLEDKNALKSLQEQILSNQLLEKMSLDKDVVMTAKGLCRGMFGSIDEYLKQLPHFQVNNEEYMETMSGLIGAVSGVIPENFNVRSFLRDLYKQLLDPKKKDIAYFQRGSNAVQYAYYQLAKNIQINPMILMLTQGILAAWKTLNDTFYNILDQENKFLNPIIVLQTILSFTAMPTLVKEIYTEQEWFQQQYQFVGGYSSYDEFVNQKEQLRDITDVLFAEQLDTKQQMMDFADEYGIDRKITNYVFEDDTVDVKLVLLEVLSESVHLLGLDEDNDELIDLAKHIKQLQESTPETTFEQAIESFVTNPDDQEKLKKYKPKVHQRTVIKCYQELEKLFIDPRFLEELPYDLANPLYIMQYQQSHDTVYYNMGVCTTLASLKRIYWQSFDNITPKDDEHTKIVTHQIDYILTAIERLYFFKNSFDYFSKPRTIQLIGLATGVVITAEHMIYANCTASLSTIQTATRWYDQSKEPIQTQNQEEKVDQKFEFLGSIFDQRDEYTQRDQRYFKDFKYETIKRLGPDIITEPENYINGCIQMTASQTNPDKQGFNWEDYFYDIAFLQKGGDLVKWCRFQGNNKFQGQNFSNENREKIMQLQCKELFDHQMEKQFIADQKDYEDKMKQMENDKIKNIKLAPQQSIHQPVKKEASLENCMDPRTDQLFSEIVKSQNKFAEVIQTQLENFQLVVDIFKGNYQSIIEPDTYFTDEEPQAAPIYYGLVAISGSYFKVQNGWRQNTSNDLSRYLNSCCWNTPSNKKNMQEILSVYFRCFEGFSALGSQKSQDIKLLNSFIQLSCGLSEDQQQAQLETLIQSMSLATNDANVLITLIQTYLGEVDQYYKLAEYSSFIKQPAQGKFKPIQMANMIKTKRSKATKPLSQSDETMPVPVVGQDIVQQPVAKQSAPGSPKIDPKDTKKDLKKDPKKDAKKDDKDKPAEGDKPKKKEIKIVKKTKKKDTGIQSSGDMYFSVKKILNKLLYGFDQSELHNKPKIDWDGFDFSGVSALSLDPDKTEEAFTILLWQLAQAVTKDTITDQLKLPIISEGDTSLPEEFTKVYQQNKGPIQQVQDFIISLLKDDYSFFFKNPDDIKPVLEQLKIIDPVKQDEDLSFLKAMIGLKSNKMQAIMTKRKFKGGKLLQNDQSGLNIEAQVKNLVDSKIIAIKVDGQSKEKNEQISKDIALLFLAISSGNINKIVEALINRDGMSACFVLTLYLWKNFTTILMNPKLYSQEYQVQIFPAIQLLPLLIFSQINEQQDLVKGVPRSNKRDLVFSSLAKIVQFVKEYKPNQEYYQDIDKFSHRFHKKKQQFQWSLWISLQPNFLAAIRSFNQQSTLINEKDTNNGLQTNQQCEYLFKLLTGYTIVEKVQNVKFLGNIIKLYLDCNKIINFPNMVEVRQLNFKTIIPQCISTLQDVLPESLRTYVGVFDKFVQLFVFIQIPSTSIKAFQDRQNKSAQQNNQYEEEYDDDHSDDEEAEGQGDEEEEVEEEVEDENVVAGPSSDGEKIIIGLVLDVIQQTVNGLWTSFKKDNQLALTQKIDNLSKELKNKEELMMIQQKQQEKQQQIMQSNIFQSQLGQQIGQQTQPMQQPLGGSSPGLLPSYIQGVVQGQLGQIPFKSPPPPPPIGGKNQPPPPPYDFVALHRR